MKISKQLAHGECSEWNNKLSFYNEDLILMRKELDEAVKRNNSGEFLASLEHFQLQISLQQHEIDLLKYEIGDYENILEKSEKLLTGTDAADTRYQQPAPRNKIAKFEELFRSSRQDHVFFLSKWM